jgi:hypothetical protein
MATKERRRKRVVIAVRHAHAIVVFWQCVALLMLNLFVWVNEMLDLPAVYFEAQPRPFDPSRACVSCAAILLVGIVLVGHTYIQEQQIIRGLISICSHCKKIRIDSNTWQQIEQYVGKHGEISFTHGICPECLKRTMAEVTGHDKTGGPGAAA